MSKVEPKEQEISISSETIVRIVFILGFFALAWFLRDILLVVLTAVILASALEPLVRFFVQKNVPRLLALVLIYTGGGGFFLGLIYFFVPAILSDVSQLTRALPNYIDMSSLWNPLQSGGSETVRTLAPAMGFETGLTNGANVVDLLKKGIEQGGVLQSASIFFGGFLSFVLIVVLSFYLSAQERGVEHFLRLITPAKSRGYVIDLWKRSQAKIGLWFQGQVLLGILVGVLTFLGLTIMGVPSALFLAVLIMTFELIPVFGPILAAVPAVAIAFTEGIRVAADPGLTAALIVGVFYFIIQQFESHLIYPLVVRKVIGIPPVLVILALVIGAKTAGFLGILISVPVTAILMEFLNDVARDKKIFED